VTKILQLPNIGSRARQSLFLREAAADGEMVVPVNRSKSIGHRTSATLEQFKVYSLT
jgi:hypothetical protein